MSDGITLKVLGDFGPFSRMGKSIGYRITIGKSSYLIDCGSPLFQQIGGYGLKEIKGLIVTHSHDDHKRWFTDLALFNMYAPDIDRKISLLTSEGIYSEIVKASGPALDRSLAEDSKKIIDISHDSYIDSQLIGPRVKYRITSIDEGNGKSVLRVTDNKGDIVSPETAKIVISSKTKRPRMLFKDPDYMEWIEPESFYSFSSEMFYENVEKIFRDEEGFSIEAIKAPVWHGVTAIGVKIRTDNETLIFSSDTVNNVNLWKELCTEKINQSLHMTRQEFESAHVIYGDINDYIERIWSEERYNDAIKTFDNAVVVHDISIRAGAVHTEYNTLKNTRLKKDRVILTHGPDQIASEWALCDTEKTFRIKGYRFFEVVGDKEYPMNADIYNKDNGRYFVGYKNKNGRYRVYEKNGILSLSDEKRSDLGTPLYNIDIYQDISGSYFPKLENKDLLYQKRSDGKIELVEFSEKGSKGTVVEDHRDKLLKK